MGWKGGELANTLSRGRLSENPLPQMDPALSLLASERTVSSEHSPGLLDLDLEGWQESSEN